MKAQLRAPAAGKRQAEVFGVHQRQLDRWRSAGIGWARADELAVAAGLHPGEVWAEWWSIAPAEFSA